MATNSSKFIWPATALVCAAIIGTGTYLGLRSDQAPTAASYDVPTTGAVGGTAAGQTVSTEAVTVYVTRSGECYHRAGCSSLSRSKILMGLSEAKQRYRPCGRCNPPR